MPMTTQQLYHTLTINNGIGWESGSSRRGFHWA